MMKSYTDLYIYKFTEALEEEACTDWIAECITFEEAEQTKNELCEALDHIDFNKIKQAIEARFAQWVEDHK